MVLSPSQTADSYRHQDMPLLLVWDDPPASRPRPVHVPHFTITSIHYEASENEVGMVIDWKVTVVRL
jgi:hypothetical protein